jgi:hypothetical protein
MMPDRIRQSLAFVIAIGMVIAVASAPTVAQVADENAERVFEAAGLNADRVDGQHAVKYSTKKSKRANKLVATNAAGYLPSNIVRPKWSYIKGKPASFTDGQIGWYEVANKPGGFADNQDNAGVTQVTIKHVRVNGTISGSSSRDFTVSCPSGYVVTGGGITQAGVNVRITDTSPWGKYGWVVTGFNLGLSPQDVSAYAICMITKPNGTLTIAGK